MDSNFVQRLQCPTCGGGFAVKVFVGDVRGIEEGILTCEGCGRVVPIVDGVPRILPPYLNRALVAKFPEFFRRHSLTLPQGPPATPFDRLNQAIFDAFNYNWVAKPSSILRLSRARPKPGGSDPLYHEDRRFFLDNVAPLDASFFKGKLGLDAGCNVGRYLYSAHECGAEMIGLEQTFAVDRARSLTRGLEGIHLVQGSIFEFPFKEKQMDFAFCFGVLHHTPDAPAAFRSVASVIKPGGACFTMLYGIEEMSLWYRLSHMRSLRALSTRLPLRATRKLCEALAATIKYGILAPLSAISGIPGIGPAAKRFPFMYLRHDPVIAISRNFFDRLAPPVSTFHTRPEIEGWYRNVGFGDIRVTRREMNAWRAYGVRGA